jgi:hypothetical protein
MAHFARVAADGTIAQVVVISNEDILSATGHESESAGVALCEQMVGPGPWVQTSYHGAFRRRYAAAAEGISYDPTLDAFILPQPFPSWALDLNEPNDWSAPTPMPDDDTLVWTWSEESLSWVGHERVLKPEIVVLGH